MSAALEQDAVENPKRLTEEEHRSLNRLASLDDASAE